MTTARRTIVFDVGGVIVPWQPEALVRRFLAQHASDDAAASRVRALVFESHAEGGDWSAFDRGAVDAEALAQRIARRSGLPREHLKALIDGVPHHLQPMPESVALIERLRVRGHRLALLSNMPRPYAAHLEAMHPCFAWFEHRAWSGRLGVMKPQRAAFDHLRDAAALDLQHALFVDDHIGHVDAARSYGWKALHFKTVDQCAVELAALGWL